MSYDLELRPKGNAKLDVSAAEKTAQANPVFVKTGRTEYGPISKELTFELFISGPDNFVAISIPYWNSLNYRRIFELIFEYAQALDLEVFDPQMEKYITPGELGSLVESWNKSLKKSDDLFDGMK